MIFILSLATFRIEIILNEYYLREINPFGFRQGRKGYGTHGHSGGKDEKR